MPTDTQSLVSRLREGLYHEMDMRAELDEDAGERVAAAIDIYLDSIADTLERERSVLVEAVEEFERRANHHAAIVERLRRDGRNKYADGDAAAERVWLDAASYLRSLTASQEGECGDTCERCGRHGRLLIDADELCDACDCKDQGDGAVAVRLTREEAETLAAMYPTLYVGPEAEQKQAEYVNYQRSAVRKLRAALQQQEGD